MKKNNILNIIFDKNKKILEIIIFILFLSGVIFLSFFHEPWYDEFQAWGIAKDSLYNILFVIPHMEGHPPLWHLILKFMQQFTDNPELVIKIPNITFMACAIWLLIFKSPFPRIVRLTLPFTFFLFYQYSILNRPYSLMTLSMFLSACLYKNKDLHPFRFISSLALLCLTSAYGMLIATGITIAWVIEIWNKQNVLTFLKNFLKDKRFFAMLGLFFVCLLLTFEIYTDSQIGVQHSFDNAPFYLRFLYFYLGLLSDAAAFNILNYLNRNSQNILDFQFILASCFGLYLNFLLIFIFQKLKKLSLLILTYFTFLTFGLFIYMSPHHIGIVFLILLFCFWVSDIKNYWKNFSQMIQKQLKIFYLLIITVQIYWSCTAFVNEIKYEYSTSREIASFISKYNLTDYNILSGWHKEIMYENAKGDLQPLYRPDGIFKSWEHPDYKKIMVEHNNSQIVPVIVNPYFNKNIFYNYNSLDPEKLYLLNAKNGSGYNDVLISKWKKLPQPDILILSSLYAENMTLEDIWGEKAKIVGNYILIDIFSGSWVWKNQLNPQNDYKIYVHKNLYEKMKDYKQDNNPAVLY